MRPDGEILPPPTRRSALTPDEALACAVSDFLMSQPPAEWPLPVVEALDRYARESGFRGWERGPLPRRP